MISVLLAASLTFTATATGVEKNVPVEFVFAGRNTDRDYEAMFLVDDSVDELCARMEKAGLPCGRPTNAKLCRLWPIGCPVRFEPALTNFIACSSGAMSRLLDAPVYTGGTRLENGLREAGTNMPASVFSTYTLAQSPIVPSDIVEQGVVYGSFTPRRVMKKGEKVTFTVSWDADELPRKVHLTACPGNASEILKRLRTESEKGVVDALIGFSDDLTVREATAVANALSAVDSTRVRINGCSNVFYRAFLPLVKWLDRQERLVQPFELTLGNPDTLVFIEEDWSGDNPDPKLTPKTIAFSDTGKFTRTETCFIFAEPTNRISQITAAMSKLKGSAVSNWYVFTRQ